MVDPVTIRPSNYIAVQEAGTGKPVIMQVHENYKKMVELKDGPTAMYFFKGFGLDKDKAFDVRFDMAFPIKANQELLLSCGFIDMGDRLKRPEEKVALIKQVDGKYGFFSEPLDMLIKAHLIQMHDIQNVWFDMLGTEINIELAEEDLYTMFGIKTGV